MIEKGAALFHSLVANHCFHNGNKRTAALALDNFVLANSYIVTLRDTATYELARSAASYRQRGKSHDEVFDEIVAVLRPAAFPFSMLKEYPDNRRLLTILEKQRRYIRQHPLNRKIP